MSRLFGLTSILLLFFIVLGIAESSSASEPDAVLFSRHRPDSVLLVKDPAEVAKLTERVLNNERVPHACEGDWAITFRFPDSMLKFVGHSEDHERYLHDNAGTHELLEGYFSKLCNQKEEDRTTLIRLTVGADVPVEEAIEALENGGEEVFFFGRQTDRLPGIVLESSASALYPDAKDQRNAVEAKVDAKADALLGEGIEVLKQWKPVVSTTPIKWLRIGGGPGGYEIDKEITIFFPFGTDLSNMPALPDHVVLGQMFASEEYVINIVSSTEAFDKIQESLPGKYPFVRDVMRATYFGE